MTESVTSCTNIASSRVDLLFPWCCAGPLAAAANQNEEVEEPWSTYLHLWHAILQLDPPNSPTLTSSTPNQPSTSSKIKSSTNRDRGRASGTRASAGPRASSGSKLGLHALAESPQQVEAEQQAVYDALLRAVLDGVRNLDLEYHQVQNGDVADASQKLNSPDNKLALRQVSTNKTVMFAIGNDPNHCHDDHDLYLMVMMMMMPSLQAGGCCRARYCLVDAASCV